MEIPLSVKESEKKPIEIEGGGSGSAETLGPGRGQKLPLSPRRDEEVEGSPKSATMDADDDWFVSDSGSEEEEEDDDGNQGINSPFTVDEFPRASCDPEEQTNVFIDIKIAGYKHVQSGCADIFGFVAVRDEFEPLRNYVYRRGINSCEAICVKRKTGDYVFVRRMYGERCALDVKYMVLKNAVEARVEVKVIRLGAIDSGVNLRLHAKTGGFDEVIRLFQGAAPEPGSIRTFVVAVDRRNDLDLYIEAAPRDYPFVGKEKKPMSCSWLHSFEWSDYHGTDECEAKLGEFAELSVKVIWKSYR
ncbi:unnamed protein product [Urochloa decumbens]|uniref:DUF6598 domain-containing protein n=1 Tax=Urochloa decumbens TaxID=240449 RepID=A0ABC9GDX6_9POAL